MRIIQTVSLLCREGTGAEQRKHRLGCYLVSDLRRCTLGLCLVRLRLLLPYFKVIAKPSRAKPCPALGSVTWRCLHTLGSRSCWRFMSPKWALLWAWRKHTHTWGETATTSCSVQRERAWCCANIQIPHLINVYITVANVIHAHPCSGGGKELGEAHLSWQLPVWELLAQSSDLDTSGGVERRTKH